MAGVTATMVQTTRVMVRTALGSRVFGSNPTLITHPQVLLIFIFILNISKLNIHFASIDFFYYIWEIYESDQIYKTCNQLIGAICVVTLAVGYSQACYRRAEKRWEPN